MKNIFPYQMNIILLSTLLGISAVPISISSNCILGRNCVRFTSNGRIAHTLISQAILYGMRNYITFPQSSFAAIIIPTFCYMIPRMFYAFTTILEPENYNRPRDNFTNEIVFGIAWLGGRIIYGMMSTTISGLMFAAAISLIRGN